MIYLFISACIYLIKIKSLLNDSFNKVLFLYRIKYFLFNTLILIRFYS